jgi:hypothetical protein
MVKRQQEYPGYAILQRKSVIELTALSTDKWNKYAS